MNEDGASRWSVLGAYAAVAASTQMLWLTYAPITTDAAGYYGVSEGAIGALANVFPLFYVVLAIPAGRLLDRAPRPALAVGALLTAAGALVRLGGDEFAAAIVGQLLVAVAQPLVLNALASVAVTYLAPRHRASGIAAASAALFAGMILAFVLGAALVGGGLYDLLVIQAVLATAGGGWLVAALRTPSGSAAVPAAGSAAESAARPVVGSAAVPAAGSAAGTGVGSTAGSAVAPGVAEPAAGQQAVGSGALRRVWREPRVRRLVGLVAAGFGVFVAISTWLQALLEPAGVSSSEAGLLLLVMVGAGMIGSALLPPRVARTGGRGRLVGASIAVTATGCLVLAAFPGVVTTAVVLVAVGALLLADLPVLLDAAVQHQHSAADGATTTSLLWLAGNAGGVVVALAVQGLLDHPAAAFALLAGCVLAASPLLRGGWLDAPTPPALRPTPRSGETAGCQGDI